MSELIQASKENGILSISLNRPDKKNALTAAMYSELADIFKHQVSDINAVILSGGTDFTAGNDLADFLDNPPINSNAPVYEFMRALSGCPVPVIAAVDGVAVGIGTTLLLHCDFVYATANSLFVMPFINLAVVPEFASSLILPQRTGYLKAAEMLLLGDKFDSATALQYGIISRVCDADDLLATAKATADKLVGKPREALIQSKALMRRDGEPLAQRIAVESEKFSEMIAAPEAKAAINKILKR
jgi:enoyl-CoA hydratase/carnithine racemase|tara:strand:- start:1721 stop:2452 length:732 start_codon:yes stop_codon:yes gene_type:complete